MHTRCDTELPATQVVVGVLTEHGVSAEELLSKAKVANKGGRQLLNAAGDTSILGGL